MRFLAILAFVLLVALVGVMALPEPAGYGHGGGHRGGYGHGGGHHGGGHGGYGHGGGHHGGGRGGYGHHG